MLLKDLKKIPSIAIICGSGVKILPDIEPCYARKYEELPLSLKKAGNKKNIKGHDRSLKICKTNGKDILIFSGRYHLYEGFDITEVTILIRLAFELGVKKIIITNAAGGINKNFKAGELMLITGIINFMQPNERGVLNAISEKPEVLNSSLMKRIKKIKKIKTGNYAGMLGPSYETISEIKLLSSLGANAVGMSTIPEILCAKSLGLDFAAISIISNVWSKSHKPSHLEVLHNVQKANSKLNDLILQII